MIKNKTIWIAWFQGWDMAPELCGYCLDSWKYHNPDWDIVILDKDNYRDYCNIGQVLPDLNTNNLDLGDILRLFLMKDRGGVWVDATCFCNKPLDSWVHDYPESFVFTRTDKLLASWFIAGVPDSYLIETWYEHMLKYWNYRISSTDQYQQIYWIHPLFRQIYSQDQRFKSIIDSMDKLDCTSNRVDRGKGAHLFAPYTKSYYTPVSDEIRNRIDSKVDPVYKLSYKVNVEWREKGAKGAITHNNKIMMDYPSDSELYYLLSTIND